jgi:branched-chain amino acid transport system ATP-binding protein
MKHNLDEVMSFFPILAERRQQLAGRLSGGERQMCAVARAMMGMPKLMMLDEPSLGLAPIMVDKVFELVKQLVATKGLSVLLVEQNVGQSLEIADRAYVLENGSIRFSGSCAELLDSDALRQAYLGL